VYKAEAEPKVTVINTWAHRDYTKTYRVTGPSSCDALGREAKPRVRE